METPNRDQLRVRYGDEQVLVVPAGVLQHLPTGVSTLDDPAAMLPATSSRPRWQVEHDPAWRQLVCYIVLRQQRKLFLTERLRAQGEARLHSLFSVGVGGHINLEDGAEPLQSGWRRELAEELDLDWSPAEALPRAIINDLSNEVSRDHVGILYLVDVPPGRRVAIRETDKMCGQFVAMDRINADFYSRLESWSQLVVDFLQKAQD